MNYSIFRFTLNMHNHRSQASVSAFRGDTAIRLYVTLTDGGVPYYINDGCSAILCGTKADGTKLFNRCVIENNAVIRYDFTEQTTSCIGVANCEITLYDEDGDVITAPKFVIVVDDREASYESIVESHSERDALDALMVSARNELERAEAEKARIEAEAERQLAEAERIKAEEARSQILAKGVGDSSVVLNDLENNDAGLRGYVIQSISGNTIYLDSVEGLAVGDVVSFSTYDYAQSGWRPGIDNGVIASVGENSITLTTSVSGFTMSCPTHDSRLAFKLSVRSKPWLGTADVSMRATSVGRATMATGDTSFTSGRETKAKGDYSSASGRQTEAAGEASMADGYRTKATAHKASAKGESTLASGESSSAEGIRSTSSGLGSHAEGIDTKANGKASHTEGSNTTSHGSNTHTEGKNTVAIENNAHAEGMSGKTLAEKGLSTSSSATAIEAAWDEDFPDKYAGDTFGVAYGTNSHVEGRNTLALKASHAEGCETKASADGSHSEGVKTKATGTGSHAEGTRTTASGSASHAEGSGSAASGGYSHAQGQSTKATGVASSAGGISSEATADCSDAVGENVKAKVRGQSVRGKYNADDSEAMFIVGAGTSTSSRRNAFSTGKDSSGNMFVKVGAAKVTESMIKQALDAVSSVTGETTTWFEEVSTKGVLTLDSDVLPYVKLGKLYGKHYNIKANTPISLPDATIYETSWDETNKLVVKDNEFTINAETKAFDESISYYTGLTTPIDFDGKVRVYFLGGGGKISGAEEITIEVVGDGYSHTLQMPLGGYASPNDGENCVSGLPSFPKYIRFPIPYDYSSCGTKIYEDVSFDIYIESDTSYEQTFVVTGFETSEGERVDIPHMHFQDVVGYGLDKNYYDFADGKYYEWQTYDENGQLIDLEVPIVHDCLDKPSPYLKVSPGVTITPTGSAINYPYTYSPNENTWECLIQRKVGG